jgi:hypothetical protein
MFRYVSVSRKDSALKRPPFVSVNRPTIAVWSILKCRAHGTVLPELRTGGAGMLRTIKIIVQWGNEIEN